MLWAGSQGIARDVSFRKIFPLAADASPRDLPIVRFEMSA